MRILIAVLFLLICVRSPAQSDSTTIEFFYADKDLSLVNQVNDVQFLGISCSDTGMRGKKSLLSFEEYKNGKIVRTDTSHLICREERIEFLAAKNRFHYTYNICDRMLFEKGDSIFRMRLVGKFQKNMFRILVDYKIFNFTREFSAKQEYAFREIIHTDNNKFRIKTNQLTRIIAYTPLFNGSGRISRRIPGQEEPETWHKEFKVPHFYIISLKVE